MLTPNERLVEGPRVCKVYSAPPGTVNREVVAELDVDREFNNFAILYEKKSPPVDGPRSVWKAFEHYKRSSEFSRMPTEWPLVFTNYDGVNYLDTIGYSDGYPYVGYDDYVGWGRAGVPLSGLPGLYTDTTSETGFIPDPDDLTQLKQGSLRAMVPNVKNSMSLLNSLIELKDFKSVPRLLKDCSSLLTMLRKALHGVVDKNFTLGKLLRFDASMYLQKEFNIDPLLSDIADISTALSSAQARLNALSQTAGKVRTFYYTKDILTPQSGTVVERASRTFGYYSWPWIKTTIWDPFSAGCNVGRLTTKRTVTTEVTRFSAQLKCQFYYTSFQSRHAELLALMDRVGLNFNPSIIWNAIPWTFVIDWLVGVSRWLDDMKVGLMDPTIHIRQYSWSVKRNRTVQVEDLLDWYNIDNQFIHTTVHKRPKIIETSYKRQPCTPEASLLTTSGLSLKEFSLGSALAITRAKSKRRIPKLKGFRRVFHK